MPNRSNSLQNLRVLVIEDETLIAEELHDRLTGLGCRVVGTIDSGEVALREIDLVDPELVFMDIRLKGSLDGIQTTEIIRQRKHLPIIFLTSHSDFETLNRAKATNPVGYVLKPFHERDLLVAIEIAMNRHKLEERIIESENRYAATLASIGDGVIATDLEGKVTFMNSIAEALTQWKFQEAVGIPVEQVFPVMSETSRTLLESPTKRAIRTNSIVLLEEPSVLLAKNRDLIPIDDSAAPIVDSRNRVLGAVVAFRDIRQRRLAEDALKRAEDQLRQSQKMEAIGRLTGGVAHDFNNLLTVINGCCELLLQGESLDETSRELAGEIRKAGERAASMTRQLLAFGRKQILNIKRVQLNQLIVDISRILARLIGEDLTLCIDTVDELASIAADPSQLEQVLLNLAANARDAMPSGGTLSISTHNLTLIVPTSSIEQDIPTGDYVVLNVTDTGTGMDAETIVQIFEPFFTTKSSGVGTGLGLATVYGIMKQLRGHIQVESQLGHGSTFRLYFPVALEATETKNIVLQSPCLTCSCGSESILLIEDDESLLNLMGEVLRKKGYRVFVARESLQALEIYNQHAHEIGIVITDVVLPGQSGPTLVDEIRTKKDAGLPVLYLSGYNEKVIREHGGSIEGTTFLPKPFTFDELCQKVREVLDTKRT